MNTNANKAPLILKDTELLLPAIIHKAVETEEFLMLSISIERNIIVKMQSDEKNIITFTNKLGM